MASYKSRIPKHKRIGKKKHRHIVAPVVPPALSLPQVASATLLLDLRASQIALSEGDPVSTWTDASGNHRDFTQTGAARPTYRAGSGVPYVEFDGIDDSMTGPDFADNLDSMTIFLVLRPGLNADIIGKFDPLDGYPGWEITRWGLFPASAGDNPVLSISTSDHRDLPGGVSVVRTFEMLSRSTGHCYTNSDNSGEDISSHVNDYSTTYPVQICIYQEAAQIHAIMLYAPAPNATDRAAIEAWLATNP